MTDNRRGAQAGFPHFVNPVAMLIGIVAVGAALRLPFLDTRGFWLDEALTAVLLRVGFAEMLRVFPETEGTPPLYYVLAWLWARVFGSGEIGLRSLSTAVGLALIPVAFYITRRLASERIALLVAWAAAINPFLVWYSLEARSYALLVLLGALSFHYTVKYRAMGSARAALWWAVTSALALWTHYMAICLVAVEVIWLAPLLAGRLSARLATGAVMASGAALIPLILRQHEHGGGFIRRMSWLSRLDHIPVHFLLGDDPPYVLASAAVVIITLAASAWLLLTRTDRHERQGAWIAGVAGIGAIAVGSLMSFNPVWDYVYSRNFLVAWLPLTILLCTGLGAARAGRVGPGVFVLYAAFSLTVIITTIETPKPGGDWRSAVQAIPATATPRIVIVPYSGVVPFQVYRPSLRRLPVDARQETPLSAQEILVVVSLETAGNIDAVKERAIPAGFSARDVIATRSFLLQPLVAGGPEIVTGAMLDAILHASPDSVAMIE